MRTKTSRPLLGILLIVMFGNISASAFYDPVTQRWLNRDPLGDIASLPVMTMDITPWSESGGDGEMSDGEFLDTWTDINGNLYSAMRNSPINYVDFLGLCGEEALKAAEKALDATRELLKQANEAVKAEELGSKGRDLATEQAKKLMEKYQIQKAHADELREAVKASRFWPKVGRFFKAAGATLITIPARIPLMFMLPQSAPGYDQCTLASTDAERQSGQNSSESLQTMETGAGRVVEQYEGEKHSSDSPKQISRAAGTETNVLVLVSAK
jgi:hypothetical protein